MNHSPNEGRDSPESQQATALLMRRPLIAGFVIFVLALLWAVAQGGLS